MYTWRNMHEDSVGVGSSLCVLVRHTRHIVMSATIRVVYPRVSPTRIRATLVLCYKLHQHSVATSPGPWPSKDFWQVNTCNSMEPILPLHTKNRTNIRGLKVVRSAPMNFSLFFQATNELDTRLQSKMRTLARSAPPYGLPYATMIIQCPA